MKQNEVFTKFDKRELLKNHQKWKPIAYMSKDGYHLVVYFWKETSILGMKFQNTKKPRTFAAKLQPKQYFVLDGKYFPLSEMKYYDSLQEPISFPSAINELKLTEEEKTEDVLTKIYTAQMEDAPFYLVKDEWQQLQFSTKEKGKPVATWNDSSPKKETAFPEPKRLW